MAGHDVEKLRQANWEKLSLSRKNDPHPDPPLFKGRERAAVVAAASS
jgi:hypothetical protein